MYEIKVDTSKLKFGFANIKKAAEISIKNTLNTVAFLSRKNALQNINNDFNLRNNLTKKNIQVEKAENTSISNMFSSVGARDKISYMALHEEGGIKKSKTGNNILMAQTAARNGSNSNLVSKELYYNKIKRNIIKYNKGKGNKKSRLIAAAYEAYKKNKFLRYKDNIYKITGFTKAGDKTYFTKEHIYNLSQKEARIEKREWLKPAIEKPIKDFQNIFNSNINKLLKSKHII